TDSPTSSPTGSPPRSSSRTSTSAGAGARSPRNRSRSPGRAPRSTRWRPARGECALARGDARDAPRGADRRGVRADVPARRALDGRGRGGDRRGAPAVARDPARLSRRVPLRGPPAAERYRGACGRRLRARALPAPPRPQPRRPADAVPQHGSDVARDDRGGRRPAHGGLRRGRARAWRLRKIPQIATICPRAPLRRRGGVSRFSASEPAGLRVCRLSVFFWAVGAGGVASASPLSRGQHRRLTWSAQAYHVVSTGVVAPEGTTTQPTSPLSVYGALSGTVVSPVATAKAPHGSGSFPSRAGQNS